METFLVSRMVRSPTYSILRNLYSMSTTSLVTPAILQYQEYQPRSSCPTYSTSSTTTPPTTPTPSILRRSAPPDKSKLKSGSVIIDKIRQWLNFEKKPPKTALRYTGYLWYCKIADEINFDAFYKACRLPDTFTSWFLVVELHVWLLSTRLMEEPDTGKVVRNAMIKAMWEDIDIRSKKLEGALSAARRQQIQELNEQFQAALLGYDDGLLSRNDTVLAGALWRKFLNQDRSGNVNEAAATAESSQVPVHEAKAVNEIGLLLEDVIALELLVSYARSEHHRLQQLSRESVLFHRDYKWTQFDRQLSEIQKFHKR